MRRNGLATETPVPIKDTDRVQGLQVQFVWPTVFLTSEQATRMPYRRRVGCGAVSRRHLSKISVRISVRTK